MQIIRFKKLHPTHWQAQPTFKPMCLKSFAYFSTETFITRVCFASDNKPMCLKSFAYFSTETFITRVCFASDNKPMCLKSFAYFSVEK